MVGPFRSSPQPRLSSVPLMQPCLSLSLLVMVGDVIFIAGEAAPRDRMDLPWPLCPAECGHLGDTDRVSLCLHSPAAGLAWVTQ